MSAASRLKSAKEALDADPENPSLQREFKKVADDQIPKLDTLAKEFTKKFGEKKNLNRLQSAVALYATLLQSDRLNLANELKQLSTEKAKEPVEMQIQKLDKAIEILSTPFYDTFSTVNDYIPEMDRISKVPMSWDKDFMSVLNSRTLLGVNPKEPLWKGLLRANQLEQKDVTAILKLHQSYQSELKKIAVLERKLEVNPADKSVRTELVEQLRSKLSKLARLGREHDQMKEKVERLHSAVEALQSVFIKSLYKIEKMEDPIKIKEYEKESRLSVVKIRSLAQAVGSLKIKEAFNQKTSFMQETYKRFARRPSK